MIRKPILPIEVELRHSSEEEHDTCTFESYYNNIDDVVTNMCLFRRKLFDNASQNIKTSQERYKKDYDVRRANPQVGSQYNCFVV